MHRRGSDLCDRQQAANPLATQLLFVVRCNVVGCYATDTEDGADVAQQDEDEGAEQQPDPEPDKGPLDLDSLEEPPSGAAGNPNGDIVTNPLMGHADREEGGPRSAATLRHELHALAEELQRRKRGRDGEEDDGEGLEGSRELWGRLRNVTGSLSQRLCEQLRLVLEPMVATKLQGDYRSGKRINMRRVIPYIASGFRKDKIWLRRTKPAKRDYQVGATVTVSLACKSAERRALCDVGLLSTLWATWSELPIVTFSLRMVHVATSLLR